jgi:hypothetical protein
MKLNELAHDLHRQGYKKLGHGADASVWTSDGKHVIKILMPTEGKLSHAVRTFKKFYRFCQHNSDIENLPHFYELPSGHHHEPFTHDGIRYHRIAMERLYPLRSGSVQEAVVWQLSDFARGDLKWAQVHHKLQDSAEWATYDNPEIINSIKRIKPRAWEKYHVLYVLMQLLYNTGQLNNLGWDLHTENVMRRRDGTLVVIDPWFAKEL